MGRPSRFVVEMEHRIALEEMELARHENDISVLMVKRDMVKQRLADDKALVALAVRTRKKATAGEAENGVASASK